MSKSGSEGQNMDGRFNPGRRELGKRFLGASLGGAAFFASLGRDSATTRRNALGIKIAVQSPARPTDDDLLFLKQLGAEYVSVGAPRELRTADGFLQIKKRYESAGITVWNIGNMSVHNKPSRRHPADVELLGVDKKGKFVAIGYRIVGERLKDSKP